MNRHPNGKTMQPGLNLEFARTERLALEAALRCAAEAGYDGVLSIECDTLAQAQASYPVLQRWIQT